MKSERLSLPRSFQAVPRRVLGNGDRTLAESKGSARGQVAKKQPPNAVDLQTLLHLSQQLYAHALTLQEVLRNKGEVAYEALRPRYDRQAAQQFEIFYHTAITPKIAGRP